MESQEKLKEFIETNLNANLDEFAPPITLAEDDDIFQLGISDSLFMMKLMKFVEEEFAVTVENDDLEMENFSSVVNVMGFVERKRQQEES
ncbi:MAG: acyl carrier protein [bacterium]|nr:acyl carrier protein [bacterium]